MYIAMLQLPSESTCWRTAIDQTAHQQVPKDFEVNAEKPADSGNVSIADVLAAMRQAGIL